MLTTSKKLTKSGEERNASVTWSDSMRKQFILAMMTAANSTTCSTGFKSEEWTSITTDFNKRVDSVQLTRQQLQNQYTTLKSKYCVFHTYSTQSGFGIDNSTKLVTAEPGALRDYLNSHPKAREYEFKSLTFYDLLHELFTGAVATGKHAALFVSPPTKRAVATPTTILGNKRGHVVLDGITWKEDTGPNPFDDVPGDEMFGKNEADDSSDSDHDLGHQHFKKQDASAVIPGRYAPVAKILKEKPAQSVTRLLGTIVDNQQKLIERLPYAVNRFTSDFSDGLSVMQKIKVKKFLSKDNNAEVFTLCSDAEKTEFIKEILEL